MLVDAHIHLGMFDDIPNVIKKSSQSNIQLCQVGINLEESSSLLKLFENNHLKVGTVPVFVGIHPWYGQNHNFDETLFLELLKSPYVVGIGECGLDSKIEYPLNQQIKLLEKHLDLASKFKLPVNLHIRGCHGDLIRTLKKYQGKVTGIIHNFTFSYEIAKSYLDLGYVLSIGHHILMGQDKHNEVIKKVGLDKILLETDLDYEHTGPYDPSLLKNEYDYLCRLLNLKIEDIENTLQTTFEKVIRK